MRKWKSVYLITPPGPIKYTSYEFSRHSIAYV